MNDLEFLEAFEKCLIPKAQWKHRDHIRMAWLYLKAHPYDGALEKIRNGIQKLNLSFGSTTGYHDTVTCLFALYISNAMKASTAPHESFGAFFDRNSWLSDGKNPFRMRHYSDAVWNSQEARDHFVLPDLEPLPERK